MQRRDGTIAVRLLTDVGAARRDEIDARGRGACRNCSATSGSRVRFPAPLQAALLE